MFQRVHCEGLLVWRRRWRWRGKLETSLKSHKTHTQRGTEKRLIKSYDTHALASSNGSGNGCRRQVDRRELKRSKRDRAARGTTRGCRWIFVAHDQSQNNAVAALWTRLLQIQQRSKQRNVAHSRKIAPTLQASWRVCEWVCENMCVC